MNSVKAGRIKQELIVGEVVYLYCLNKNDLFMINIMVIYYYKYIN